MVVCATDVRYRLDLQISVPLQRDDREDRATRGLSISRRSGARRRRVARFLNQRDIGMGGTRIERTLARS